MHRQLHDHTHLCMQLERVMKSLFLRRLFIWPRYEAGVKSTLEGHESEVRHRSVRHLHDHTCHCLPSGLIRGLAVHCYAPEAQTTARHFSLWHPT